MPTKAELLRKIVKAEIALEKIVVKHTPTCPADDDTGWPAECTCGAGAIKNQIAEALEALKG